MKKDGKNNSAVMDARIVEQGANAFQILNGYAFPTDGDIRKDIVEKYGLESDLLDIYIEGGPQLVHKWHHYLPIYERYFAPWRSKPVRFLELGVSKGGSLSMWRRYFG